MRKNKLTLKIGPIFFSNIIINVKWYTFLLELSSELKERKHESESLWWRVFGDCGVAETGYSPRHLISTLPPFNTGMVLVALLTWLDLTIQVSVQMSSPPRSRPWLRIASFTLCPVILYCIIFILSQGALTTICNSHLIDLPSCSLSLTECWLNEGRGFVHCLYL